jgi:hypothetical protein
MPLNRFAQARCLDDVDAGADDVQRVRFICLSISSTA